MQAPLKDPDKPQERKLGLGPKLLIGFMITVGTLAVPVTIQRARQAGLQNAADSKAHHTEAYDQGSRVYIRTCVSCHEPRGEGKIGRYPTLVKTPWVLDDKETPIRIVLLGISGPIEVDGQRYDGYMPNLGVTLSDENIANVLTFVRSSWGNDAPPISADDVARVRASLGDRTEPWKGGDELLEAKKAGRLLRQ